MEPEGCQSVLVVFDTHAGPGPGQPGLGHPVPVEPVDVGVDVVDNIFVVADICVIHIYCCTVLSLSVLRRNPDENNLCNNIIIDVLFYYNVIFSDRRRSLDYPVSYPPTTELYYR